MADSFDYPEMMVSQGSEETGVLYSVAVSYERFKSDIDLGSSTSFINEFITVKALDPSLNPQTDFTYPTWPPVSDRAQQVMFATFDSAGELPT